MHFSSLRPSRLVFNCIMVAAAVRVVPLANVARVGAGYPFRGAVDALEPGSVGVIQMRNVESDAVEWTSLTRVALPSKRRPDYLAAGDVIFTTRGRRNYALALSEVPGDAVCSPHFFVLRVREPESLSPSFLAWQINQKPAQEYLQQAATGSHILNITRAAIENLPITIPPIALQLHVVALADAARHERRLLNDLVDNRQRELDGIANQILNPRKAYSA
jgi:hypothetical protein